MAAKPLRSTACTAEEALVVIAALDTGGFTIERSLDASYLTDAANIEFSWVVRRSHPPFCDAAGNRQWHGPTAIAALTAAQTALRLKDAR